MSAQALVELGENAKSVHGNVSRTRGDVSGFLLDSIHRTDLLRGIR